MKLSKTVQETLKKYRQKQNLSQEQLAESSNLDRTYISGFERGIRNISLLSLEKMLEGLHLDCTTFFKLCIEEISEANNEESL